MLLGEFVHSIDVKGRLAIPVKFRPFLGDGAILTKGLDRCLFVFGGKEWQALAQKIVGLPLVQADSRAFARLMLGGATDVRLDAQGRVLVPDYLRTYAGLEKQVIVAGLYNRTEIWNADAWEKYKGKTEESSEEIAERLSQLGV